jgi:uncharacterized heparinase superfamily protein
VTRAALYLHALRTARARQLRGRATRIVSRRRFPRPPAPRTFRPLAAAEPLWRSRAFAGADEVAGDGTVRLLGRDVPFPPADWLLPGEPRLRRFHLHYGEEALGWARRGDGAAARAAMHAWIAANPARPGDAWHPYPLATRVGNWIAALSLIPELADEQVVDSLRRQLAYLERNVEDDVLGNHVIRNARALALGAAAFEDGQLLRRARELLRRELPEQVLADGGHYERSPAYHLVVLRDLLEVRAATALELVEEPIGRMERFAAALARPDGAPALFNDGALDLAPELELPAPPDGLAVFPDTGYAVLRQGDVWLAFDCGPPSPPYLPPHAHADALSFQLWVGGRPVVVDPGAYTYEAGPDRAWFRSTRAHSTVAVDGRDQFVLWGAFRTGPLPRVRLTGPLEGEVETAWYRHRRRIEVRPGEVLVEDELDGAAPRATSRLVLAPGADDVVALPEGEREPAWLAERLLEREPVEALVVPLTARIGLPSA